jgi:Nucleotidyl transferase
VSKLTLLVMAAGSGTRYGTLKQIEEFGPSGEALVDYSIFDAARAGFHKVVFVIRRDIEESFRATVGRRIETRLDVEYVFQGEAEASIPVTGINRKKPWGTAHAVLSAIEVVHEPFAVINADDFYGRESFSAISEHLQSGDCRPALVGFALRNALSPYGSVMRGLCVVEKDTLQGVAEVDINTDGDQIYYVDSAGIRRRLTGSETVSMNMWGFYPEILLDFRDEWIAFSRTYGQSEGAEFYIPSVISNLISQAKVSCRVLQTPNSWFGVTYPSDRPVALTAIRELIAEGVYPERLWAGDLASGTRVIGRVTHRGASDGRSRV